MSSHRDNLQMEQQRARWVQDWPWMAILLAAAWSAPIMRAHDHTLARYEASLAGGLGQEKAPLLLTAAEQGCRLQLQLIDAESGRSVPGLIRVKTVEGALVSCEGLVSRGWMLAANHPANEWFAVLEPTSVALPAAELVIEAFSGLETEMCVRKIDLRGQAEAKLELPLVQFHNARESGWRNGNTHLHLKSLSRSEADRYLQTIPQADRLELLFVSYLLRPSEDRTYISNQYTKKDLESFSRSATLFGNGQEHRHNFGPWSEGYGHVMFLNIPERIEPVSIGPGLTGKGVDYPPLRRGIQSARAGGATVIWCHNRFGLEDTPNWVTGLVHAQNIFDGGAHGSYEESFYRFLNVGLRVPFSTGTDWFIYDFARVYVSLTTPLTVQDWLSALEQGRSFISNGPLLSLEAGSHRVGDTVAMEKAAVMPVKARAAGRSDFQRLELIRNGQVIRTIPSRAVGNHFEALLETELEISQPVWLALRAGSGALDTDGHLVVPSGTPARGSGAGKNELGQALFAHSSPIYFDFQGKRVFDRQVAAQLLEEMRQAMAAIEAKAVFEDEKQRQEVLGVYRRGMGELELLGE